MGWFIDGSITFNILTKIWKKYTLSLENLRPHKNLRLTSSQKFTFKFRKFTSSQKFTFNVLTKVKSILLR